MGLPTIFFDLVAEHGALGPVERGQGLSDLLDRFRRLPVSIADQVGEPLLVFGHREYYDHTRLTWAYMIVGERSGQRFGTVSFSGYGDDVRDTEKLDALALGFRIALNRPWTLPDEVFHAYHELTGWEGLDCDYCDQCFPDWRSAEAHELASHGVVPHRDT